jgi:predicted methyltransferase
MKSARNGLLAAVGISAGIFLNTQEATAQQNRPALSFEQIAQIVNSTDRTAADRTNDVRRKPEQMLGFIGIRPGIVAVDLSAGGGYTTELLARAIGPSARFMVRADRAIPARYPHPRSRPRATATRSPRRARRRQRQQARHVFPLSPSPNAKTISEPMASRQLRSSRSPSRLRILFRPNSRWNASIS